MNYNSKLLYLSDLRVGDKIVFLRDVELSYGLKGVKGEELEVLQVSPAGKKYCDGYLVVNSEKFGLKDLLGPDVWIYFKKGS